MGFYYELTLTISCPKAKRDTLRTSHEGRSPEFRSHRRMSPWNSNRDGFAMPLPDSITLAHINSNISRQPQINSAASY